MHTHAYAALMQRAETRLNRSKYKCSTCIGTKIALASLGGGSVPLNTGTGAAYLCAQSVQTVRGHAGP